MVDIAHVLQELSDKNADNCRKLNGNCDENIQDSNFDN